MNSSADLDLGPLSWVKGEIDLALERTAAELEAHAAAPSAAALEKARNNLHQAHGALAIVGLNGLIEFADAIEQLLAAIIAGTASTNTAIAATQTALTTLRAYLDDLMAGHANQPLRLLPAYRAMAEARGLPSPSAVELFFPDMTQRPPKREQDIAPLDAGALAARLKIARMGFERGLLKWIKNDPKGIGEMKISVAMIEKTRVTPAARAYWWIALGALDALAANGLNDATEAKKFAMRLGAQIKKLVEGNTEVPEHLLREALYLVAGASAGGEHVSIVRAAYRLEGMIPSSTPNDAERLLPSIRRLRDLLAGAKEDWNRLCAGTAAALVPFHERVTKIAEEGANTGQSAYRRLTTSILVVTDLLRRDPSRHTDVLALEMATALLLAESALEFFDALDENFAAQSEALASRLDALGRGEQLGILDMPMLDAMSRRAQERLLLESVAREIRTNLGVIEQTLDAFFRDPAKHATLSMLTQPIRQIEGALAVLGEERANSVLWECRQIIEEFAQPDFVPIAGEFENLAKKLSALGFFVEQLQHGPADIDAILEPQPATVAEAPEPVAPVAAITPVAPVTPVEPVAPAVVSEPTPEPVPEISPSDADSLPQLEAQFEVLPAPEAITPPLTAAPVIDAPAPSEAAARMVDASAEEIDAELLGIFLEEAHEVLATIANHLPRIRQEPADQSLLTTLRRSFHTLKGSGRMVGLTDLGETAWVVEQAMNQWLHLGRSATPALQQVLELAYNIFRNWVAQLADGGSKIYDAADLERACQTLLRDEEPEVVEEVVEEAVEETVEETAHATPTLTPTAQVVDFPAPPPVRVGNIDVMPVLYNLYIDEARGHVETLQSALGLEAVPGNEVVRAAHTTASISAATGFTPIAGLAHALENALYRLAQVAATPTDQQRFIFARCAGALEGMIGAVAERRMPGEELALTAELDAMLPAQIQLMTVAAAAEIEDELTNIATDIAEEDAEADSEIDAAVDRDVESNVKVDAETTPAAGPEITVPTAERRGRHMEDDIDFQLLPLFLDESVDLMRDLGETLRAWRATPHDNAIANALQRTLHTLKGSARMAGAMGCGELLHSMESRIEQAAAMGMAQPAVIDGLETSYDRASLLIDRLRNPATAPALPVETSAATAIDVTVESSGVEPAAEVAPEAQRTVAVSASAATPAAAISAAVAATAAAQVHLRVRADLIDQLVNEAGGVAIVRTRIEGEMRSLKSSLLDLTENVIRLRKQLREIEITAESQMQSQQALVTESGETFDPLEFDRFTRFQEMTRMMAESVNDVATVQHGLLRNLDHADAALAAQARLNRELSQRLMTVRMVPFDSLAERLHRVVRQAAKDTGKRANLDILKGQTNVDRSVLDKMAGPIEHLLRNSVAHGLEERADRLAAGKDDIGQINVALAHEGNEIVISIADDGAGLNFAKIRAHGIARGLIAADAVVDDAELTQLIFQPGFSTAQELTELAGRGIGMDVVKNEAASLGGRIEVTTTAGQGSTFRVYLPLTLAVTQAVMVSAGNQRFAIPSSMVEQASELKPDAIAAIRAAGSTEWLGTRYPWRYLPELLGENATPVPARRHWLLLIKGGTERVALEVDGLTGNQEIVVKAIGPQLARVPGLAGATVLGDGEIALILNPIALLSHALTHGVAVITPQAKEEVESAPAAASVMVVDDSLTVRKISGRLLARQGYHVLTAKDGVDALEQLREVIPDVMLVDIELPRMDGFDLTRNIRADARLRHIPIIMITSRSADKHRNHATEIGVNGYMGKPYDEEELLAAIAKLLGKAT